LNPHIIHFKITSNGRHTPLNMTLPVVSASPEVILRQTRKKLCCLLHTAHVNKSKVSFHVLLKFRNKSDVCSPVNYLIKHDRSKLKQDRKFTWKATSGTCTNMLSGLFSFGHAA